MFWSKFNTVDDVPRDYFENNKSIYAFVERIIDGDTIRVRHVPFYGIRRKKPEPLQQRGIAKDTLSIRIYGVDTPEIGKNKRQTSQPFGEDAKKFTTSLVYHKMVKITFLRKDQYSRAVAVVETVGGGLLRFLPGFGPKDLTMELATAGLAELYTGGGAVYNGKRAEIEKRIALAQRKKRGMWVLGDQRQSAAERKREMRGEMPTPVPVASYNKKRAGVASNKKKKTAVVLASKSRKTSNAVLVTSTKDNIKSGAPVVASKTKQERGSKVLEAVMTGLEFA